MKELLLSIQRNALGLSLFAIVTAGTIAVTYLGTADRISANIDKAANRALFDILDNDQSISFDSIPLDDRYNTALLGNIDEQDQIRLAIKEGNVAAVLLPAVNPNGYTTDIRMIVGIQPNGDLAGVRVIEHRETPGLGDKIDRKKSDWILSFNGKSLENTADSLWAVKKDGGEFDQFTGATITPRAVVTSVKQALEFFQQHKSELLSQSRVQPLVQNL